MNIILLNKYNCESGVVTHVINLALGLKKKGHTVYIMAPLDNGKLGRYETLDEHFIALDFTLKSPVHLYRNVKKICDVIKEKRIDILHSHNRSCSIYANIVSKKMRIPFIWSLHLNNIPSDFIHRKMTFCGERVILVSENLKEFCINKLRIDEKKLTVIVNGISEENYTPISPAEEKELKRKWSIQHKDKVITLLGRLEEVKGHRYLIEAAAELKDTFPFKILLCGGVTVPQYKVELDKLIDDLGMRERVVFTGYVKPREVLGVTDISVLPSENEGFLIAAVESFLLKVPVIRTKTAGYSDMQDCCYLTEVGDVKKITEYLQLFFEGNLEVQEITKKAYQFVINECTTMKMTDRVLEVYHQVLESV